jgi:methylphosphotriester-DNA--protein-cysteine methyltransferase
LAKPNSRDTIDDWAVAVHMSRRAFTRLFRQETGMSLSAWRQQAIVVVALSRLLSGEIVTARNGLRVLQLGCIQQHVPGATPTDYLALNEGALDTLSRS